MNYQTMTNECLLAEMRILRDEAKEGNIRARLELARASNEAKSRTYKEG